ncbi:hypothetical protein HELRODRAFT_169410 [Helobdella robusta]|uniref:Uncharacterized protein n=1 Tax=Helobdella robusta TaxID=6412 RepID=T1F1W9_HELRO|nr:hypothetical protein HELRODRAFT_169410 [Helobdella robusta]ESO08543.1 hypothetical protein HELRODRAFT_169410 [Helobdella robusta]
MSRNTAILIFIAITIRGLVAEWLACPSTTPTTRVRILQFFQIHPGSRPPVNPAVHPFEVTFLQHMTATACLSGSTTPDITAYLYIFSSHKNIKSYSNECLDSSVTAESEYDVV